METQARSSQTCGGSSAGPALVELQEDSSQKFTDLWMELCSASNGGDSSQNFPDLWRKLCRSRTGEIGPPRRADSAPQKHQLLQQGSLEAREYRVEKLDFCDVTFVKKDNMQLKGQNHRMMEHQDRGGNNISSDNICKFFQTGFCKYRKKCKSKHEDKICENSDCNYKSCFKRHP